MEITEGVWSELRDSLWTVLKEYRWIRQGEADPEWSRDRDAWRQRMLEV